MMQNQATCPSGAPAGPPRPGKPRMRKCVVGALLLACAHQPTALADTFPNQPDPRSAGQVGPVQPRETAAPQPVHRNREEIEADIQALEAERANLLTKYASAHPDVRAVERRLQLRRQQLEMLKQAPNPPK